MTRKKAAEQIAELRRDLEAAQNNLQVLKEEGWISFRDRQAGILEEHIANLENTINEQGWIRIVGGTSGKELSKNALDILYDIARVYWIVNPLVVRMVEVQALFVWGLSVTIKGDHPRVDAVVRKFLSDRKNRNSIGSHAARKQNERDLRLAGNLFFALFTKPATGRVVVRTFPFYEIQDIVKNPDDRTEPWFYKRIYAVNKFDPSTGVSTPATETVYYPDWQYDPRDKVKTIGGAKVMWDSPIYHLRTNCLPDMTYGISEVYSCTNWAKAYKRFMENWSKLVEAYANFAFNLTTRGGPAAVAAAKSTIQQKFARENPNDGTQEGPDMRSVAGTMVSTEGVTLSAVRTAGATTSMDDARPLRLMCCSGSGTPDQILAGDPSTGNLATAKAMERPLELQFRDRQELWAGFYTDLLGYVIDQAIKCPSGQLADIGVAVEDKYEEDVNYLLKNDPETGKPIPRSVAVQFPPLLEHDILQYVQAIIAGATLDGKPLAGTMDLRTVAEQVIKALNVENAEEILKALFGDAGRIMQTDYTNAMLKIQTQTPTSLYGPGGVNPETDALMQQAILEMQAAARKVLAETERNP